MLSNRTEVTVTVTVIVIMTQGEWCGGVRATSTSKIRRAQQNPAASMLGFGFADSTAASHKASDTGTGTGSWLPFHVAISTSRIFFPSSGPPACHRDRISPGAAGATGPHPLGLGRSLQRLRQMSMFATANTRTGGCPTAAAPTPTLARCRMPRGMQLSVLVIVAVICAPAQAASRLPP